MRSPPVLADLGPGLSGVVPVLAHGEHGGGGHGWQLALFPLLAAALAAVFAGVLAARFAARRRPAEGAWGLALAMYAVASFAMFLGVFRGWHPVDFRLYWLFGAVLNVPWLLAGEVYLLAPRTWGHGAALLLVVASVYAARQVLEAPLNVSPLAEALPLGREVFGDGSVPHRLAQYYSFPAYFLLLGGLVWSTWQMRARRDLRGRAGGTLAVAVGATIVAVGSGIGAGFDLLPLFSVSLAAGVGVMFWGFLLATRPTGALVPP